MNCDVNVLKEEIASGSDASAVGDSGIAALSRAVRSNCTDAAWLLLASGADITSKADNGLCALELAQTYKHEEMITLLRRVSVQ